MLIGLLKALNVACNGRNPTGVNKNDFKVKLWYIYIISIFFYS